MIRIKRLDFPRNSASWARAQRKEAWGRRSQRSWPSMAAQLHTRIVGHMKGPDLTEEVSGPRVRVDRCLTGYDSNSRREQAAECGICGREKWKSRVCGRKFTAGREWKPLTDGRLKVWRPEGMQPYTSQRMCQDALSADDASALEFRAQLTTMKRSHRQLPNSAAALIPNCNASRHGKLILQ
ncbi:hypothetical protein ANO11243_004780 [Dothideomycetidae sp. 11243]|nr:hypothetical protein ANO11243_004780 [fungal sp. No.11243]